MLTLIPRKDQWLLRLLLAEGLLALPEAEGIGRSDCLYISHEVLRRGLVTKARLAEAVRSRYGIGFAEPDSEAIDKMAVALVPERLCLEHLMVPMTVGGDTIDVLMADPISPAALDAVAAASGRRPIPVFGLSEQIEPLIAASYGAQAVIFDLLRKFPEESAVQCVESGEPDERPKGRGEETIALPVIQLANLLIAQAVRLKASDVHVEHDDRTTLVRYRIDGDLRSMMKLPKALGEGPLVSRIKIMANLDVSDRRRPQDGRAKLIVGAEEIGLRVSTMPTSFGEKVVLRIVDRRAAEVPLDQLGLRPDLLKRLLALATSNQGMLLITGPTGSGKTTTLYSLLHRVKAEDINVVTVEDPIEYRLKGITQVQVNEKAGLTFASVLRSVLRQDPDVVLVGEIRDRETADVAFQAALTGHMVFSTLHTNDSVSTVGRLLDMGVERFKLAPALIGVAAHRLVRRLCAGCREELPADPELAQRLREAGFPERQFAAAGCQRCQFTGLNGRIALTELLDLSAPEARDVLNAPGERGLRAEALARGWLSTLSLDALWHVSHGDIPLLEALSYLEPRRPGGTGADPPAPAARAKKRVLVVDDNADNRAVVLSAIGMDGYDAAEVDGGAAALAAIAARKPDLLLLDLMMPDVDGFAVLKALRGPMGLADIPVMVITAMSEAESQAAALAVGADDYMIKPFSPRLLRARVKALFVRVAAL